jgi:DNA repair photolyase
MTANSKNYNISPDSITDVESVNVSEKINGDFHQHEESVPLLEGLDQDKAQDDSGSGNNPTPIVDPAKLELSATPESKRATAITDIWPRHAYIAPNNFRFKSLSNWSLNVAVGCTHGCLFCYVPSTSANKQVKALGDLGVSDPDAQWGQYVFIREWDENKFLASLRTAEKTAQANLKIDGNRAVMLCTTTDPYQTIRNADPARQKELNEKLQFIVRRSLELIRDHSTLNVRILTRGPQARRDFEVMKSLGDRLLFGMSLPTLNEKLIKVYEPSAPGAAARLKTLEAARSAGLNVYVAVAPTYPECNEDDMRATLRAVKELNPVTVFHEPINIRAENVQRIQVHATEQGVKLKTEVFETDESWKGYAVEQLQMAERIAIEVGLGDRIHLWPDKSLGTKKAVNGFADVNYEEWLWKWWNRVSEWPGKVVAHEPQNDAVAIAGEPVAPRVIENPQPMLRAFGKAAPSLNVKTPDQILEMKFDPSESYLFDGLFSKGQVMTLVGPGGIGKSRLLLQLAAAMITGKEFLGIQMPPRQLRWLFIQNENNARRLQSDFMKIKKWVGDDVWQDVSDNIFVQTPDNSSGSSLDLKMYKVKKKPSKITSTKTIRT